MKTRIRWASTVLALTVCQFATQARADITAGQLVELQAQAAMAQAKILGVVIGIVEGCAQSYPELRGDADSVYAAFGVDRARIAAISPMIGACLDRRSVPAETECRRMIRLAGTSQDSRDMDAFFDAPGVASAAKMLASCQ
jgi:hypothetical protein